MITATTTNNWWQLPSAAQATHYYWKVTYFTGPPSWVSGTAVGLCDFSTIVTGPPPAPSLSLPVDSSTNMGPNSVVLNWATGVSILSYQVLLSTNPSFTGGTEYFLPDTTTAVTTTAGQTYYWKVRAQNSFGWGNTWSATRVFYTQTVSTTLNLKVFLQGPLIGSTPPLMGDQLRVLGLLPTAEPYSDMSYSVSNYGATVFPPVITTTGNNAAVDWILVDIRHGTTNNVLQSWACILQRDGDVWLPNGASLNLQFPMAQVKVGVRHRNHLGVMTASNVTANGTPLILDLTLTGTTLWGTEPTATVNGRRALWCGDTAPYSWEQGRGIVSYTGIANDRSPVLQAIGGVVPTSTLNNVYDVRDVNLDGIVKYTNAGNDRDPILTTIGGVVPTDYRIQQLPWP